MKSCKSNIVLNRERFIHYQLSVVISECLEYLYKQINVKILFLSFSQKFHALKITGYTGRLGTLLSIMYSCQKQ